MFAPVRSGRCSPATGPSRLIEVTTTISPTIASTPPADIPAPRANPAPRLATTTAPENTALARLSTGLPNSASAATALALMATSIAPAVAPTNKRTTASASGPVMRPGMNAITPKSTPVIGRTVGPYRSISAPVSRIVANAPTAIMTSARPS